MAKTKNKKNLSEKHNGATIKKTLNPFEVHINKEKMAVLGRKLKHDRGLPGISRAKALNKRKHTLLQEYKLQNKSNKFVDKRIGERNFTLTEDEKSAARFAAVRRKAHTNKKSIFNLPDEEFTLTHKGQSLEEIEKFDDPRSDDDLEDEEQGRLDSDFVGEAHFGGGILMKTNSDGAKTHKDLINELIAESKKRKAEQHKIKEATLELTEKLDTEWKDLMPLVNKKKRIEENKEKEKLDEYDRLMGELKFEARGGVSDRLKSEEEVAREEKEKLEKLERERLERMNESVDNKPKKPTHRSADDLDDDFVYESDTEPDNMLTYDEEGRANVEINAQLNGKEIGVKEDDDEADESDDNVEEDEDNESDSENKENASDNDNNEEEGGDEDEEDNESEDEDNLSDLKQSDSSDEEETEEIKSTQQKLTKEEKTQKAKQSEEIEQAKNELPFTFKLPESYEDLQKLFKDHNHHHISIILERMIKCNHPSLGKDNKENLNLLFAYLLQYLNDCASEAVDESSIRKCFQNFGAVTPHLFDLAQLQSLNAQNSLKEVLKEKHEEFRKRRKIYPGLEVLIFLKLVSVIFSTSDFRHPVVTPSFVFMEQMLNKCRLVTRKDISYGLFLCTLILEYTTLSKRYHPACINYLGAILHMSIPKTIRLIKVRPPFKANATHLVLEENCSDKILDLKMNISDLVNTEIDDEFRCRSLQTALHLIGEFEENHQTLSSNVEIYSDIADYLQQVPSDNYPEVVRNQIKKLTEQLDRRKSEKKLEYIVMEASKPKALRLLEPKIEEVYDGKRRRVQGKEKAERDKLLHKLKKETKGALREIRRDKSFLGRVKIQQQIRRDQERKEKVRKLFAEASIQQSELNKMDRQNKKKK